MSVEIGRLLSGMLSHWAVFRIHNCYRLNLILKFKFKSSFLPWWIFLPHRAPKISAQPFCLRKSSLPLDNSQKQTLLSCTLRQKGKLQGMSFVDGIPGTFLKVGRMIYKLLIIFTSQKLQWRPMQKNLLFLLPWVLLGVESSHTSQRSKPGSQSDSWRTLVSLLPQGWRLWRACSEQNHAQSRLKGTRKEALLWVHIDEVEPEQFQSFSIHKLPLYVYLMPFLIFSPLVILFFTRKASSIAFSAYSWWAALSDKAFQHWECARWGGTPISSHAAPLPQP